MGIPPNNVCNAKLRRFIFVNLTMLFEKKPRQVIGDWVRHDAHLTSLLVFSPASIAVDGPKYTLDA